MAEIYRSGGKDIWAAEPTALLWNPPRPQLPPTSPALVLFYVTACIRRGIVWRFPLERTGKAGRNIWLLSFLIVQKAMRSHAWLIYSMLSNRKQPPGNGIIVMKCNIIVKCHVLLCLFKGSESFPRSLSWHEVSGAQGGNLSRNHPIVLPQTHAFPNPERNATIYRHAPFA